MKIKSKITVHIPQANGILILEENQEYKCQILKDSPVDSYIKFKDGVASINLLNEWNIEVINE